MLKRHNVNYSHHFQTSSFWFCFCAAVFQVSWQQQRTHFNHFVRYLCSPSTEEWFWKITKSTTLSFPLRFIATCYSLKAFAGEEKQLHNIARAIWDVFSFYLVISSQQVNIEQCDPFRTFFVHLEHSVEFRGPCHTVVYFVRFYLMILGLFWSFCSHFRTHFEHF